VLAAPAQELMRARGLQRGHGSPGTLFATVFCRAHCQADPNWAQRTGGHEWDTVKHLASNGLDPAATVLVDDSARKVLAAEAGNVLLVPTYRGAGAPLAPPEDIFLGAGPSSSLNAQHTGYKFPVDCEDVPAPGHLPLLRLLCGLLLARLSGLPAGVDVRAALPGLRAELAEVRASCGY
jgi:hypothetical protein